MKFIDLVGPNRALSIFGIKLVGVNAENGRKLLLTLLVLLVLWLLSRLFKRGIRRFVLDRKNARVMFWSNQSVNILAAILFVLVFLSIWFDDPARLATAFGLVSAGLAFALQKVITAFAGYVIILRGRLFNVGDRISMAGIRGDVISLSFMTTSVMEMGQPPAVQMADPAMWVQARQYTGRIVTITNDKIFDMPVYNYSWGFPYLWEEMQVMIKFSADHRLAEQILLDVAKRHTLAINQMSEHDLAELERRYAIRRSEPVPKVYYRITDNWLELSVRFITRDFAIREVKDLMSRDILDEFEKVGIEIASTTIDIVGMPLVLATLNPSSK